MLFWGHLSLPLSPSLSHSLYVCVCVCSMLYCISVCVMHELFHVSVCTCAWWCVYTWMHGHMEARDQHLVTASIFCDLGLFTDLIRLPDWMANGLQGFACGFPPPPIPSPQVQENKYAIQCLRGPEALNSGPHGLHDRHFTGSQASDSLRSEMWMTEIDIFRRCTEFSVSLKKKSTLLRI